MQGVVDSYLLLGPSKKYSQYKEDVSCFRWDFSFLADNHFLLLYSKYSHVHINMCTVWSPLSLLSCGLNSSATVLLQEWLWHWITLKSWYVSKKKNNTKHVYRFENKKCIDYTKTSCTPIYGLNSTTTVLLQGWFWH